MALIENGIRFDKRKLDEMRPLSAEIGILKNANGSAIFKMGNTIAIAGVYGPREVHPKHEEDSEKAILRCTYSMSPFSTTERNRPGPSRRSKELSMIIRKSIEPVLFLEEFRKTAIDVHIEIIQANASTRCAAINAAVLALVDAGISMKDLVSSCAVGKVEDQVILDVAGKEDTEGQVDLPVAYYPKRDWFTMIQMDGMITKDELKHSMELVKKGCKEVYEVQKKAILDKYQEE